MKDKEKYLYIGSPLSIGAALASHLSLTHIPIVITCDELDLSKELVKRIEKECVPKHYEVIKNKKHFK